MEMAPRALPLPGRVPEQRLSIPRISPLGAACWEYALEAIMYDEISNCIHKVIKLSLYKHLMCIIEYVIRLWNYAFMLFVLNILGH